MFSITIFNFSKDIRFEKVRMADSVPLGILKDVASLPPAEPLLPAWEKMHQRELRLAINHPPENIYEEMINWTNEGKLWKFPINNYQGLFKSSGSNSSSDIFDLGMEAEENVPFSEHIFLDKHLEGWCPKKGPVRHFMELVCVGLSKNPYFSVEEKKENIQGYREYFESKQSELKELGAV